MKYFGHSGDIGDIIYSLPTIKALGKGVLCLFDSPGKTAHGMTEKKAENIRSLLKHQEYIEDVVWSETPVETNLNGFRDHHAHGVLADMHLATHGLDWTHRVDPWLTVPPPSKELKSKLPKVAVHWTTRYQNSNFPWSTINQVYKDDCGFIGTEQEHKQFVYQHGPINFVELTSLLEVAQAISNSLYFIGSQSSPLAIAHGLKHPTIMCISPGGAQQHCVFQRMNCIIGWDSKMEWPKIS